MSDATDLLAALFGAAPPVLVAAASVVFDGALSPTVAALASSSGAVPGRPAADAERRLLGQVGFLLCALVLHASAGASAGGARLTLLTGCTVFSVFVAFLVAAAAVGAARRGGGGGGPVLLRQLLLAALGPVVYSLVALLLPAPPGASASDLPPGAALGTAASFLAALAVACGATGLRKSRAARREVLAGIPLAGGDAGLTYPSSSSSYTPGDDCGPPPDREVWWQWTPDEVGRWTLSLPERVGLRPGPHLDALLEERVDGAALAGATAGELRTLTGMPYGEAAALRREVDALGARFGTGGIACAAGESPVQPEGYVDAEQWLERGRSQSGGGGQPSGGGDSGSSLDLGDHQRMSERAEEAFQGRFGIRLARFSSTVSAGEDPEAVLKKRPSLGRASLPAAAATAAEAASPRPGAKVFSPPVDKALLASMPAHLRDIAERQPDLVNMLLRQKAGALSIVKDATKDDYPEQQQKQQQRQGGSMLNSVQRAMMNNPSYASRHLGAQAALGMSLDYEQEAASESNQESVSWPDGDESSDTAGLLLRRSR